VHRGKITIVHKVANSYKDFFKMKFQTIFYFVTSSLAKQFCFGQDYCLIGSTTDGVTTFTVHSANDG
jgi:hypothetical protein